MDKLSYAEVGATAYEDPLPANFRHLCHRVRLDEAAFAAAADAILDWRVHNAAGIRIPAARRAVEGLMVTGRVLILRTPCRVVWAVDEPDRAGFAYGTLPGHPFQGEESFVVSRDADGVWFTVRAFSRPARWFTKLAGPLVPLLQRFYAWRFGRVIRALTR